MSIIKTTFRNDSLSLQQPEVKEWLETYASDYFDSISESGTTITCKINNITTLEIFFSGTMAYKTYLSNGNDLPAYRGTGLFVEAVATSKGLCITYINSYTSGYKNHLIITKDINNDIMYVCLGQSSTSSGDNYFLTGLFSKYSWSEWANGQSAANLYGGKSILGTQAAMTSLVPITDKTWGTYSNGVYLLIFNQYYGQAGQFTIDGVNYYTNGFIALAD